MFLIITPSLRGYTDEHVGTLVQYRMVVIQCGKLQIMAHNLLWCISPLFGENII